MVWKKYIAYFIAVLFIGLSFLVFWSYTKNYQHTVTTMTTLMPTRLLHVGEVITDHLVRQVTIPKLAHKEEAITDLAAIRGKTVVVPIGDNEEFLSWKLTDRLIAPKDHERYYSFKANTIMNVSNMVRKGDIVDVWMNLNKPVHVTEANGSSYWIGSVKIISNLLVASVKSQEGAEIVDQHMVSTVVDSFKRGFTDTNAQHIQELRSTPNAAPDVNTYIMTDEIKNVYTLGEVTGTIQLSLPNLYKIAEANEASITETFLKLQDTGIFDKEAKVSEIQVDQLNRDEVSIQEEPEGLE